MPSTSWECLEWMSFSSVCFIYGQFSHVACFHHSRSSLHLILMIWSNVSVIIATDTCAQTFLYGTPDQMISSVGTVISSSTLMLSLHDSVFIDVPYTNRSVLSCIHSWPWPPVVDTIDQLSNAVSSNPSHHWWYAFLTKSTVTPWHPWPYPLVVTTAVTIDKTSFPDHSDHDCLHWSAPWWW